MPYADMYLERCFQSFNTASGKYYCNYTIHPGDKVAVPIYSFNTASGKYYCNGTGISFDDAGIANCFNTASGKYYCNEKGREVATKEKSAFQYRKR